MTKRLGYILLMMVLLSSQFASACQISPESGGNVLRLSSIDPITLDPAVSGEMTSHQYVIQLFSGLVRLNDEMQPVPDIAREWQLSDDGKVYTFVLRDDVKFHDGRQLTANDFKYSWERAASPETGSSTALIYLGDIVGVREMLAGESTHIQGLRVVDDFELEVTVDAPKSYFLAKLSYPTTFVVDKANVEKGGEWWRQPNGTGPFRLKVWEEAQRLVLQRSSNYYGDIAEIDEVVFQLWGGQPMNLYETGDIDVAGVSMYYIDRVMDKENTLYQEFEVVPELSFSYIGYNISKPPFDDANIRRAFAHAVDRSKLASLVFRDMMQPADGILPPGLPGYNPALNGLDFDVAKARELIAESSYGDVASLPPITLTTMGWGGLLSSGIEAVIEEWRRNLGVEVTVRQLEPERFLYHLDEEKDEMFEMGWIADYPHPQNFLEILFSSSSDNNYGDYGNAEIDSLLAQAGITTNSSESLTLYQEAEQKLVTDAACLPLWFGRNYYLVKPEVKNYHLNPLGLAQLNKVSITRQ